MNDQPRTDRDGRIVEEAPKTWKEGMERQRADVRRQQAANLTPSTQTPRPDTATALAAPATGLTAAIDESIHFWVTTRKNPRPPLIAAPGSDDRYCQEQDDDQAVAVAIATRQ